MIHIRSPRESDGPLTRSPSIRRSALVSAPVALALACAPTALAADTEPPPTTTVHTTDTEPDAQDSRSLEPEPSSLVFKFTPYIWATSFNGTVGARSVKLDVDATFIDVLDQSDSVIGFMGAIDLEVDRLVFQLNGAYSKADFGAVRGRAGPRGAASVSVDAEATLESTWIEALGGYRLVDKPFGTEAQHRLTLDAFAGVRYTELELEQSVTAEADVELPGGGMLEAGVRRDDTKRRDWFEPFVGLRAGVNLGEGWSLLLRGDIGGFGIDGSHLSWQTVAAVGYNWRFDGWSLGLLAGYRALGQDYSDSGFTWDMITHGPVIGMTAAFEF